MADGVILPLAEDFPAPNRAEWLALVEKTLKGGKLEDLVSRTADGLAVKPLYGPDDAPGATVRDLRAHDAERPWDVRMATAHAAPAQANAEVLKDLEGGAASVLVKIDPTGHDGVAVGSVEGGRQFLDPVVAMPWMKVFCVKKNRTMIGITVTALAAMRKFHCTLPWVDW